MLWHGNELDDPDNILEGTGKEMRHVTILKGDSIPKSKIVRVLKQAIKKSEARTA